MKRDRLLIAAVVLIVIGAAGVLMTRHFGIWRRYHDGYFARGGMMPMMRGGGMMNRDQMKEMMRGMMAEMLPSGIRPEDLPDRDSSGARLVARFCSQCHDIPSPALHTAQEWPQTASRMFSRMSMMSGMPMMRGTGMEAPSTAQQKEIVEYLSRNARK